MIIIMRLGFIFSLVLLTIFPLSAQTDSSNDSCPLSFVFLPEGYHITPLKTHLDEPRLGLCKSLDQSGMKVDIGNSVDLFQCNNLIPAWSLTAGIDFFAYAYVKSTDGLRLQIDAIDGFFGGNLSGSRALAYGILETRLRILHHSAHLVDGHWKNGHWMDNMEPVAFTKDYGELVIGHRFTLREERIRYYAGTSYATLVRPAVIKRIAGLIGIECATSRFTSTIGDHPIIPFISYTMQLTGVPRYSATHNLQIGVKFGEWEKKGINIFVEYYNGRHMFAEYFDRTMKTFGAGFAVDFE
jgi:hypothetical protein